MALTVRDIMDSDPVTVRPTDDVETVVRLLRRHERVDVLEALTRDEA
jgi:Mg/Co/Ni transporter MgtE